MIRFDYIALRIESL